MAFGNAYRICRNCGREYHASRPACPGCGSTPFTRRQAFLTSGPRLFTWIGAIFFTVMAVYSLALPPAVYEQYRGFFFWLPRVASIVTGLAGAAGLTALALRSTFGKRSGKRGDRDA